MKLFHTLYRAVYQTSTEIFIYKVKVLSGPVCDGFRALRLLGLMMIMLAVTGCQSILYYSHVATGQFQIVRHRQPIKDLIAHPQTDPVLKHKLERVLEIREFAERNLHLPVEDNYLSYVDLKRPFVAWNVSAAPEFSLTPKTWYYPIVGHASYRGYFSREKAASFAKMLKSEGFDVYWGGVTAYSTLGWFTDPVFNTLVSGSDETTAALIFHELAHHIVYVSDDTTFNESFATTVEQEGLRRWMESNGNMTGYPAYLERRQRRKAFVALVTKYRQKLEELYQQELETSDMRRRKAIVFSSLRDEYLSLKSSWDGYAGYDAWFDDQLNNAKLNSVGAYYDLVPAFSRLLDNQHGNLEKFYAMCRSLGALARQERHKHLKAWYQESTTEMMDRATYSQSLP